MSLKKITSLAVSFCRAALFTFLGNNAVATAAQTCSLDCSMEVFFIGTYTDETCNVVVNNSDNSSVVTLPRISASSLLKDGSEAGSVPFEVTLKDCPPDRTISVFFNDSLSASDDVTGNLLNSTGINYSNNVQVRIRKENGSQVVIGDASSGQKYVIPASAEPVKHIFFASYYARGNKAVTSGLVQAIAGVELNYK